MIRLRDSMKRLFKKKQSVPVKTGELNVHRNYCGTTKNVCNINEFLEWARDNKVFFDCTITRIENQAAYFTAYLSFLNLHNLEDTTELRKYWYRLHRNDMLEAALLSNGMG